MFTAVLETVLVLLLYTGSIFAGWFISKQKKNRVFKISFGFCFILIVLLGLARWVNILEFIPPFSWLVSGRTKFVIWGISSGILFTSSLQHLKSRSFKILVYICLPLFIFYSVSPFLLPCIMYNYFKGLKSYFDNDGIYHQSNGYNCGPASAVTALKKLGIDAKEGELAFLFHTTPITGTDGECIRKGIRQKYHDTGIKCYRKYCSSPDEIRNIKGEIIVQTRYSFLVDHYVVILEMNDDRVILGDPLSGKRTVSYDEFSKIWRNYIIVIEDINKK